MAIEHEGETLYRINYERANDRFTLQRDKPQAAPQHDEALLLLGGDPAEFIIFDNNQPGTIDYLTHHGENADAVSLVGRAILNAMYGPVIEKVRHDAELNNQEGGRWIAKIPFSAKKQLACIGLHALAAGASQEVVELYSHLVTTQEEIANETGGGESP